MSYALAEIDTDAFPGRLGFGPLPTTARDLDDIRAWGADVVVSLTTEAELASVGGSGLAAWLSAAGLEVVALPIVDHAAPDAGFDVAWLSHGRDLLARLRAGDRVLIHCRAGQGRSGTIAARLLIDAGFAPEVAVGLIRDARPAAIETAGQMAWLVRCA